MDLVRDRCQEGGDLGVWLETFLERRRVLDDAKFAVEDMTVVALLQGLPPRFEPYLDREMLLRDKMPSLADVLRDIYKVDEVQKEQMRLMAEIAIRQEEYDRLHPQEAQPSRSSRRRKNKKRKEKGQQQYA